MYPLWSFVICDDAADVIVVTRGETQTQALQGAMRNQPRGLTITSLPCCKISAAIEYGKIHHKGWLDRPPRWVTHESK